MFDFFIYAIMIIILIAVIRDVFSSEGTSGKSEMGTIDETEDDINAVSNLIERLPTIIQDSIADGNLSLTIEWEEVTRDEDDYPTIKPKVTIMPANVGVKVL